MRIRKAKRPKRWVESWLDAPVWRFALPPGLCGRLGVLGVWMPSVDKAGRYYPLTLAAVAPFDWTGRLDAMESFLDAAEAAGRDALEYDLTQDTLTARLTAALPSAAGGAAPGHATWWTEGGSRVAARPRNRRPPARRRRLCYPD